MYSMEEQELKDVKFLALKVLYTDMLSTLVRIQLKLSSHSTVGGLPEDMRSLMIEPLNTLYNSMKFALGTESCMPDHISYGANHSQDQDLLSVSWVKSLKRNEKPFVNDAILREEIAKELDLTAIFGNTSLLTQAFSVGVIGDGVTYDYTIAIRAISLLYGMTADFLPKFHGKYFKKSVRIVNEVDHVNRIVYDITSKPPATVDWE